MESNFYSDEFEQLIREKTEQYKMYPSEKVWKGVYSSLHTKKRWFFAGMSLLVTGIIFFAGRELIAPSNHAGPAKKPVTAANTPAAKTIPENTVLPTAFSEFRSVPRSSLSASNHSSQASGSSAGNPPLIGVTIIDPVISQPDPAAAVNHPIDAGGATVIVYKGSGSARQEPGPVGLNTGSNADIGSGSNMEDVTKVKAENKPVENPARVRAEDRTAGSIAKPVEGNVQAIAIKNNMAVVSEGIAVVSGDAGKPATAGLDTPGPGLLPIPDQKGVSDQQRINWLRDYAVYNLHSSPKRNRKYWQLYMSPIVNYRTLNGGDYLTSKSIVQNVPLSLVHSGEAKDYVNHIPALGFEAGGSLLYRVTRNLTLKMGLQFNYSRYTIKAYAASPERATIALSTTYYGYVIDSITNYTSIRNFGGRKKETLNNEYYQLSLPVGFELRIMGNERLQLNIAATIQPTYLLNTNSYLLTTDYTNYTREPSLFRRWNLNGGFEAFISYKTKGIRWQIGPEFRYQLLSSYSNQYPLRENLKGYGIKIGISKAIR